MEEDNIDNIDLDWIEKFEKEDNEYSYFYKEPQETVFINFIYINNNREIEKIDRDIIYLNNGLIDKKFLYDLINKNKTKNKIKYKPISILKYFIDLDPDDVRNYLLDSKQNNISKLEVINKITNIRFNESITILHDLNCLYILFLEQPHTNNVFNENNENSIKKVNINLTKKSNINKMIMKDKTKKNKNIFK